MKEKENKKKEGSLKLLYTTSDMTYAEMLRGALDSKGIECLMKRGTGIHAQFGAVMPGELSLFKIWVTAQDYENALDIKEQVIGADEEQTWENYQYRQL